MDKEKVIKKIKQGAPLTSAVVVAACIGISLSGYQAPVYEVQAQTKETKNVDTDAGKEKTENTDNEEISNEKNKNENQEE